MIEDKLMQEIRNYLDNEMILAYSRTVNNKKLKNIQEKNINNKDNQSAKQFFDKD